MNRLTLVKIAGIVLIALCAGGVIGYFSLKAMQPRQPDPITKDLLEYYGFRQVKGGGMLYPITEIVPGAKPDTIASYITLLPAEKDKQQFWVLGFAAGNSFVAVDALFTVDELEKWIKLIEPSVE